MPLRQYQRADDTDRDDERPKTRAKKEDPPPSSLPPSEPPEIMGEVNEPIVNQTEKLKVMSINAPYGTQISAAYFDPEERKIYVLEETKDNWNWDLAMLLLEQVQPDKVLLGTKSPEALLEKVEEWCGIHTTVPEDMMIMQPHKSFSLNLATYALTSLRLPDTSSFRKWLATPEHDPDSDDTMTEDPQMMGDGTDFDAGMGKIRMMLVKLGCRVNLDAPNTSCAAGALINYIKRSNTGGDRRFFDINGIESMSLNQHMIINQDALSSLAILDTESHASMHNKAEKQSLTLYGLLNTCVTYLGKKLLHTWHLRPLMDIAEISARHDAVEMLNYPANIYAIEPIKRSMKKIVNVSHLCNKIKRSQATWRDWQSLVEELTEKALVAVLDIKERLNEISMGSELPIVTKVNEMVGEDIPLFLTYISQILDFDQSKSQDRISIRPGVDEDLDLWRRNYAELDAVLTTVTLSVLRPIVMQHQLGMEANAVYFPQLGHLAVLTGRNLANPIPEHIGWELIFQAENMQYYKTPEMRSLDDHYGDVHAKITDRESEYVDRMAEAAKQIEPVLIFAVGAIAELDCLVALASAAKRYTLTKPLMVEEPVLEVRNGRHLLHEQLVETYVVNDTALQGGHPIEKDGTRSMMVITGANGSGKSAYGKQVALLTFMAQIGSYVPATDAKIGVVDKIFTRVQTRESSSKPASAFMIDLAQISLALRGATSRSLVILDEFGKGTISTDGAGLLTGVIHYFIENARPRTVVMTHFHELFANSILSSDLPIVLAHMRTIPPEDESDRVTFLYKLSPTPSLTSNAAECALLHGVPADVVDRARYVIDCVSTFELSKIFDSNVTDEQTEELKIAEAKVRAFLSWDLTHETVDVSIQIREMLESAVLSLNHQRENTFEPEVTSSLDMESVEDDKVGSEVVKVEMLEGSVSGSEGEEDERDKSVIAISEHTHSVYSDEE